MDSTVKEGRFQREKGGKAKSASLGEVEERMSGGVDTKAFQDDLQSLGLTDAMA